MNIIKDIIDEAWPSDGDKLHFDGPYFSDSRNLCWSSDAYLLYTNLDEDCLSVFLERCRWVLPVEEADYWEAKFYLCDPDLFEQLAHWLSSRTAS